MRALAPLPAAKPALDSIKGVDQVSLCGQALVFIRPLSVILTQACREGVSKTSPGAPKTSLKHHFIAVTHSTAFYELFRGGTDAHHGRFQALQTAVVREPRGTLAHALVRLGLLARQ